MLNVNLSHHHRPASTVKESLVLLILLNCSLFGFSQETTSWWKSIFKGKNTSTEAKTEHSSEPIESVITTAFPEKMPVDSAEDPINNPPVFHEDIDDSSLLPTRHEPGTYVLQSDGRITRFDSAWKALPHPVRGYRVQLFLGTLQEARIIRAKIRKQTQSPIYLSSLPPSYRVCLGDFHDKWSAEKERKKWQSQLPLTLVIPMEIAIHQARFDNP